MKLHRDKKGIAGICADDWKAAAEALQESAPDAAAGIPRKGDVSVAISGSAAAGVSVDLGNGSYYIFKDNKFEIKKVTTMVLATLLERYLDRPMLDQTGLDGQYDLTINLTRKTTAAC